MYTEYHTIGQSAFNRRWISSCYGAQALTDAMAASLVVCSGSTAGSALGLGGYFEVMMDQYDRTKCTLHGSDQGFHEYALYTGIFERLGLSTRLVSAGAGEVNSLAALRGNLTRFGGSYDPRYYSSVRQSEKQLDVLNTDGTPSPIVHQFDRFKPLAQWARHWA